MIFDLNTLREPCICGKEHKIQTKTVLIRSGAVEELVYELLSGSMRRFLYPVILCDSNTWVATDGKMNSLTFRCYQIMLTPDGLHADEQAVGEVLSKWKPNIDLIIAVGAGTIHNISKFIAANKGLPYISVPTAASMDGFAAPVASMTLEGRKQTVQVRGPLAIYADTEVFGEAPYRMTASGISDMLGTYTALADWRSSYLLTGEPFCENVYQLQMNSLEHLTDSIITMSGVNYDYCEKLMNMLILSGLTMQMMGNSRPASGAEHQLSRFWEVDALSDGADVLHGEKVSVGLLITLREYKRLLQNLELMKTRVLPYHGIPEKISASYATKGLLFGIIIENTPDPLEGITEEKLKSVLSELIYILDQLPDPDYIEKVLKKAGCRTTLEEIGLQENLVGPSIELSPFMRNRLTMMRLRHILTFTEK